MQDDLAAVGAIDAVPNILRVVCQTTGLGFAAVARVTEEKWTALAVRDEIGFGLEPGGELDLVTTICNEIRQSGEPVVIDHVDVDPYFRDHHTPRMYGFQSYISVPVTFRDGTFFGTLCAIDPKPAQLRDSTALTTLKLFAELIALHLENRERVVTTTLALLDERKTSEQREQFIAVLGHDLRNPLAAMTAGLDYLSKAHLAGRTGEVVRLMQESGKRMVDLTSDILDMARGRLGGGVPLRSREEPELAAVLAHVIEELRTVHPDRPIEANIALASAVYCDASRLAQLLSNLLANALTHGDAAAPVRIDIAEADGSLTLEVRNSGPTIPPAKLRELFRPFSRGGGDSAGLGLGLFIASEIARAHGGELRATSNGSETVFAVKMPSRRMAEAAA